MRFRHPSRAALLLLLAATGASAQPAHYRRPTHPLRTPPAAADTLRTETMSVGGLAIPMRAIVDAIDGVGTALQEPGFYELAIRTVEESGGPRHPFAGYLHVRLARLLFSQGDRAGALEHAVRGEDILREHLYLDLQALSERDARRLSALRESALDLILTLATDEPDGAERARCWDAFLRSRAVVLDEMASRQRAVFGGGDSTLVRLGAALTDARQRLAEFSFESPDEQGRTRIERDRLRARLDSLERELGSRSARFRVDQDALRGDLAGMMRALRAGDAVVAYGYYHDVEASPPPRHSRSYRRLDLDRAPHASLMAFAIRSGDRAPAAIRLSDAGPVDSLIERWREEVLNEPPTVAARRASEARLRALGEALRRRIWDPLGERIAGARRVYVVLDGNLELVTLDALPAPGSDDRFLAERAPLFDYLTAERDLARPSAGGDGDGGLLAMGGMRFPAPEAAGTGGGAERGASPCAGVGVVALPPLPGSEVEVREIASLWQRRTDTPASREATVLLGGEATKARFEQECRGRSTIHLSTHGVLRICRESGTDRVARYESALAPPPRGTASPLLLSGLLFTTPSNAGTVSHALLTSEEIGGLDLSSAGLVVLSACESGGGLAQTRDGLLGLRRAFTVAGAHVLVVSLWPVGDRAARAFMRDLYTLRFEGGRSVAAAVRESELRRLSALRDEGRDTHPAAWAGFIATGVPAPARE